MDNRQLDKSTFHHSDDPVVNVAIELDKRIKSHQNDSAEMAFLLGYATCLQMQGKNNDAA